MLLGEQVKEKIKEGAELLLSSVSTTFGPNGANVILHNESGVPYTTKDGVSVAKKVFSEDPYVNSVIHLIRETALKTAELAGDATTTTTILATYLILEGLKNNPQYPLAYIEGMKTAGKDAIQKLAEYSKPVNDYVKLRDVAIISANNDIEIGTIVADAFKVAGENGTVLFEESPTNKTYLEESKGTIIDRGYADNAFITNNKTLTAEYKNPRILLIDDRIDRFNRLEAFLKSCISENRDLIIFAHDFSSEVIRMLALNQYKGVINTVPIPVEGIGSGKGEFIQDIAALVGATKHADGYYWGTCEQIVVSNVNTIITVTNTDNPVFVERLERIKALIENETDETIRAFYRKKLAKLAGKLCTIKVGGFTPAERKERFDRVEDAVCATKAAIEEGIVPGGGITFYKISQEMQNVREDDTLVGYKAVKAVLIMPIYTLAENSGYPIHLIKDVKGTNTGINFKTYCICDMYEAGIIDPVKAMRVSLEHAIAVASLLLNTKCIVPYYAI